MDLQPHQKDALKKLRDGKILWGRVGSGKSRVAVAYYEQEHRHKNVYVITTAKKRDSKDWEGEFAQIVVGKEADATLHGYLLVVVQQLLHQQQVVHWVPFSLLEI